MEKQNEFTYCDNRQCGCMECLRRYANAPWGVLIRVDTYYPNRKGICRYEITQETEPGWESMTPVQMSLKDYL